MVDVRLPRGARLPAMRNLRRVVFALVASVAVLAPVGARGRHRTARPRHLLHRHRRRRRDAHRHAGGRIDPDRLRQSRRSRRAPDRRRREGRRHHRDRPLHHDALAQRSRRRRRAAVEAAADQGALRPRDPEPAAGGHQRAAHRRLEGPRRRAAVPGGRRHVQVHRRARHAESPDEGPRGQRPRPRREGRRPAGHDLRRREQAAGRGQDRQRAQPGDASELRQVRPLRRRRSDVERRAQAHVPREDRPAGRRLSGRSPRPRSQQQPDAHRRARAGSRRRQQRPAQGRGARDDEDAADAARGDRRLPAASQRAARRRATPTSARIANTDEICGGSYIHLHVDRNGEHYTVAVPSRESVRDYDAR